MNYTINHIYGLLTDGDSTTRRTTSTRANETQPVRRILDGLVPLTLCAQDRRALAELYLRLLSVDKEGQRLLRQVDPINSYKLHALYPEYSADFDLNKIVTSIKQLGLPGEESSFLAPDYLLNGIRQLLETLNA